MVQFIRNHGIERAQTIRKQAQEEFTIEKEKFIAQQKEDIIAAYKKKQAQDEINLKIERSAAQNRARIERMKSVNEMVQNLYQETKIQLAKHVSTDER